MKEILTATEREYVEKAVQSYDLTQTGESVSYKVTKVIPCPHEDAYLYLFESECEGIQSAAFKYHDDEEVFVLTDWQSARPEAPEEVKSFDWLSIQTGGVQAIILNDYPRSPRLWQININQTVLDRMDEIIQASESAKIPQTAMAV